jgi:hypothetical protein
MPTTGIVVIFDAPFDNVRLHVPELSIPAIRVLIESMSALWLAAVMLTLDDVGVVVGSLVPDGLVLPLGLGTTASLAFAPVGGEGLVTSTLVIEGATGVALNGHIVTACAMAI